MLRPNQVFIAYAHEDAKFAEQVARLLEGLGYTVWWDLDIPPGRRFDRVIQEVVGSASCIVVLWSRNSVESDWVLEEAEEGRARGILVPAMVEDVVIPLGFRRIQAAVLVGWNGQADHPQAERLIGGVVRVVGAPAAESEAYAGSVGESEISDGGEIEISEPPETASRDMGNRRSRAAALLRSRRAVVVLTAIFLVSGGGVIAHRAGLWTVFRAPLVFNEERALERLRGFKVDIYYDRYYQPDVSVATAIADTLLHAKLVREVILVPAGPGLLDQAGAPKSSEIRYHKWTEGEVGWILCKELNARNPEWGLQRSPGPDLRTEGTVSIFLFSRYLAASDSEESSATSD